MQRRGILELFENGWKRRIETDLEENKDWKENKTVNF